MSAEHLLGAGGGLIQQAPQAHHRIATSSAFSQPLERRFGAIVLVRSAGSLRRSSTPARSMVTEQGSIRRVLDRR